MWLNIKRGVSAATAEALSLTGAKRFAEGQERLCVAMPYFKKGEIVNYKYRPIDTKTYTQEKDSERSIFNVDNLMDNDTGIFVEGELDVIALFEAGFPNGVSLPDGAPSKIKEPMDPNDSRYIGLTNCADQIGHITKWILAGDNDGPGKNHTEELARRLGRDKIWFVTWPEDCKDANDCLIKHGADGVRQAIESAKPHPIKSLFSAGQFAGDVLKLYALGRSKGVSTGWDAVDKLMTIRPGELSVVTGIPGSGKSEFLDAMCLNIAKRHDWKFAICSFENPPDEHLAKLAEKYVGLPFWDGPTRRMTEGQLESAMSWLDERFYFIRADDESPTFDWILQKATAAVLRHGVKGLIIDPYNEIEHKRPSNVTETEYVSNILSILKRFCQNHGVHAWFVAHPAKMRRDEKGQIPVPSLYDISGSANFVNKTDLGVVIQRNYEDGSREVDIHVKKVRFKAAGEPGVATLLYDRVTGRYSDMPVDMPDTPDHHEHYR
jgi:twinkle protein